MSLPSTGLPLDQLTEQPLSVPARGRNDAAPDAVGERLPRNAKARAHFGAGETCSSNPRKSGNRESQRLEAVRNRFYPGGFVVHLLLQWLTAAHAALNSSTFTPSVRSVEEVGPGLHHGRSLCQPMAQDAGRRRNDRMHPRYLDEVTLNLVISFQPCLCVG